jgi:hypothetical protein
MHRASYFILPAALAVAGIAAGGFPPSLNFQNQTAARIDPNQAESTQNEKEVEFGDLDNDGDLDVVVAVGSSDFGARLNKLYLNQGGVFVEMSGTALIPLFAQADVSRNAFIRDFTGDGWNDIYIINDSNSSGFAGSNKLYVAQHPGDVLTTYTEEGATRIPSGGFLGAACGGISFDLDYDGDWDVYGGHYPGPSQDRGIYNTGAGFMADVTSTMVPADGDYTVDVATADMNGDGKMDLLISNHTSDFNFIYYNDNGAGSTGLGDFRYTGSEQNIGAAGLNENSMEAADFDNDGDMDIYWSNRSGTSQDRIMRNDGNDGANEAILVAIDPIPTSVSGARRKATVADFNEDGRLDAFVMVETGGRPALLRNTSVNGTISFVDWTPGDVFPTSQFTGWHAAAFDTGGDGDTDILLGAFTGDHLFESVPANEIDENDLGAGTLPALWNADPVSIRGHGSEGSVDEYVVNDAGSGFLSIVLTGPDDYLLEVLFMGVPSGSSNRGGLGVEEAMQITTTGPRTVRVTVLASAGGGCAAPDLDGDCVVGFNDLLMLLSAWGCTNCPEDFDGGGAGFSELLLILSEWGPLPPAEADYQLEILGRTG